MKHHIPVKYGFDINKPPAVPESCVSDGGTFTPSFDNRLWMFHRKWLPTTTTNNNTDNDNNNSKQVNATLIIVHGTVDHGGVYKEFATKLANHANIAVFAMDMRGWGLSDGESMYIDDIDTFVDDVNALYQHIHNDDKFKSVKNRFLLGKSLGGTVTAFTIDKYPNHFTGLIGLSGAYQLDPSVNPSPMVQSLLQAIASISPKLPIKQAFDKSKIVSDAAALQDIENDPYCCKDKLRLGYITNLLSCCNALSQGEIISRINIPMLMMIGSKDQVVSLAGHEMMVNKSCHEDCKLKVYDNGLHNLLQEPTLKNKVMDDIQAWIKNHLN